MRYAREGAIFVQNSSVEFYDFAINLQIDLHNSKNIRTFAHSFESSLNLQTCGNNHN